MLDPLSPAPASPEHTSVILPNRDNRAPLSSIHVEDEDEQFEDQPFFDDEQDDAGDEPLDDEEGDDEDELLADDDDDEEDDLFEDDEEQ